MDADDYLDICLKLQSALNLWETCTEVSGGCLVPDKSWYTLVDFQWIDGSWNDVSEFEDVSISLKNSEGEVVSLKQLAADEAQKMLGVWLAPDGNNRKQVEEMRASTVKWAERVRTGCIDRRDAWLALTMTIMKKLEYALPALTLTEEECNFIMAPALAAGLPKAGISRTTPRAVIFGSKEFQGFGLHKLHTTMGINHIQALLDHTWSKSVTGQLMRVSLENMKLELLFKFLISLS